MTNRQAICATRSRIVGMPNRATESWCRGKRGPQRSALESSSRMPWPSIPDTRSDDVDHRPWYDSYPMSISYWDVVQLEPEA
jgi:hypothetical protein